MHSNVIGLFTASATERIEWIQADREHEVRSEQLRQTTEKIMHQINDYKEVAACLERRGFAKPKTDFLNRRHGKGIFFRKIFALDANAVSQHVQQGQTAIGMPLVY